MELAYDLAIEAGELIEAGNIAEKLAEIEAGVEFPTLLRAKQLRRLTGEHGHARGEFGTPLVAWAAKS